MYTIWNGKKNTEVSILRENPSPHKPIGFCWFSWPLFKRSWHGLLLSNSMQCTFLPAQGNAVSGPHAIQHHGFVNHEYLSGAFLPSLQISAWRGYFNTHHFIINIALGLTREVRRNISGNPQLLWPLTEEPIRSYNFLIIAIYFLWVNCDCLIFN